MRGIHLTSDYLIKPNCIYAIEYLFEPFHRLDSYRATFKI